MRQGRLLETWPGERMARMMAGEDDGEPSKGGEMEPLLLMESLGGMSVRMIGYEHARISIHYGIHLTHPPILMSRPLR